MIRHYVHDDLQAFFVSLLHIFLEEVVISETGVDVIVVCAGISMV